MLIPFDYQTECLQALAACRAAGRANALVVMASGLGKTATAAFDYSVFLKERPGARLLYLCHQNDILVQSLQTFKKVLGSKCTYGFYHGDDTSGHSAQCMFASFQTTRDWFLAFGAHAFSYVVVDEGHHGSAKTYRPLIEYFDPAFLLGMTATPDRKDRKDIRRLFGPEVYSLPLGDALARGLLTKVEYRVMADDFRGIDRLSERFGIQGLGHLDRLLISRCGNEEIAESIQVNVTEVEEPRVMIFCPSINYCDKLSMLLPGSLPVHSQLSRQEQISRLDYFRQGELMDTILTVDKFNEGIDVPEANVIVFLRSTASKTIFWQQLGRGLRHAPGKEKVVILDYVANCARLEMVYSLWRQIRNRRESLGLDDQLPFWVQARSGGESFDEKMRKILGLIDEVREDFGRKSQRRQGRLLAQLQNLAKDLGRRALKAQDIVQGFERGHCASDTTFRSYFGTIEKAVRAAGLEFERGVGGRPAQS